MFNLYSNHWIRPFHFHHALRQHFCTDFSQCRQSVKFVQQVLFGNGGQAPTIQLSWEHEQTCYIQQRVTVQTQPLNIMLLFLVYVHNEPHAVEATQTHCVLNFAERTTQKPGKSRLQKLYFLRLCSVKIFQITISCFRQKNQLLQ